MDLKNIDLKNIKIDDLVSKIKTIDKKVLIKIGIGAGSVIFFLIIYYAILNPIVEKKKIQLEDMNVKKTTKFNKEIISIKKKIKKVKPEYENYSTLFHSKAEVEGLYQTLSEYASINGLIISKINKGNASAVTKSSLSKSKKKKKKKKSKKKQTQKKSIAYYRIPVSYEIKGNFLGYIKFKRQVSLSQKMLNFDKESIKVLKGDTTNAIVVTGVLTIVGLPDEFF